MAGVRGESAFGRWRAPALAAVLDRSALRSTVPVVGDAPVVVSLTTYGARFDQVHRTIESIATASRRPRRLILWLDEEEALGRHLPLLLQRQVDRGLELRPIADHGPHKKYLGAVDLIVTEGLRLPLVTADDDIFYPRRWLAELLAAHEQAPGVIHAHRAHVVGLADGDVVPYRRWGRCWSTAPSLLHFAVGSGGILYPDRMVRELHARGLDFLDVAPRADDVWIHSVAVACGVPTAQVRSYRRTFPVAPGTQTVSLERENVGRGGNDAQIRRAYTPEVRERLARELAERQGPGRQ